MQLSNFSYYNRDILFKLHCIQIDFVVYLNFLMFVNVNVPVKSHFLNLHKTKCILLNAMFC